jgi:hypothetical protein
MARARRKNCYVPCLEGENAPFGSSELHATAAARDAQNLMDARMIMNIGIDASRHELPHPRLSNSSSNTAAGSRDCGSRTALL